MKSGLYLIFFLNLSFESGLLVRLVKASGGQKADSYFRWKISFANQRENVASPLKARPSKKFSTFPPIILVKKSYGIFILWYKRRPLKIYITINYLLTIDLQSFCLLSSYNIQLQVSLVFEYKKILKKGVVWRSLDYQRRSCTIPRI